jgi:hypothetical protein
VSEEDDVNSIGSMCKHLMTAPTTSDDCSHNTKTILL